MNIESAKYVTDYDGNNTCINAVIDSVTHLIPLDSANSHYIEVQEWVAKGNKIEDAE